MSEYENQPEPGDRIFASRSTGTEFTLENFEGMHFLDAKEIFDDFSNEDLRGIRWLAENERDKALGEANKLKDKSRNWHQIAGSAEKVIGERRLLDRHERDFKEQQSKPSEPERSKWEKLSGILRIGSKNE